MKWFVRLPPYNLSCVEPARDGNRVAATVIRAGGSGGRGLWCCRAANAGG